MFRQQKCGICPSLPPMNPSFMPQIKVNGLMEFTQHTDIWVVGMFGTSFAWHREDRNHFSINYLHDGEPKVWYSVPAQFAERLEQAIQEEIDSWPENTRKKFGLMCDLVTRRKVVHAEPLFLKKHNIPYGKVNFVDYDLQKLFTMFNITLIPTPNYV